MSGCVRMAVRGTMSVAHRQWTRAVTRADYCGGTREGSCISGYRLIFHVCDDDVLRLWYTISCCLSRRTDWEVGATAAVRGCSERCVVGGETAAVRGCFEQAGQPRCEGARPVHVSRFGTMGPIM